MLNAVRDFLRYNLFPRLGRGPERDRYGYQKQFITYHFNGTDRVLDLGSGAYPFPPATHLLDPFTEDTSHRPGEKLVRDHRPFIVSMVENLPFPDDAFDFVYCSHVLEHVSNPATACNEIIRVGRNGYIETPTRTSDILFNFTSLKNHHRWHVQVVANTLVFFPWHPRERRDLGTGYFYRQFHSWRKNPFQDMVDGNRDLFCSALMWSDSFDYVIFDIEGRVSFTSFR